MMIADAVTSSPQTVEPLKILFLAEPTYPRHQGGAGMGTHLLAAALAGRGHRVIILCQSKERTEVETIDDVEVHRVNWDAVSQIPGRAGEIATAQAVLLHLERHLELETVDVVFDSGAFLSFFYLVTFDLKERYGSAVVLQFRYLVARHIQALSSNPIATLDEAALGLECCVEEASQCFPCRFADQVVCVSHEDAAFVAETLHPSPPPLVLPEPIEPLVVDPAATAAMRASLVSANEQLLVFAGRIDDSMKGGDVVRAALGSILAARPHVKLLLPVRDPAWLEPYRRFGDAVLARPWVRDRQELATLLSAADALLMPSAYEPFGTLCAEAMQVGCPVVATRVGGLRDQISHEEDGLLVDGATSAQRAQQLAQWTLRLLADADLQHRLRRNARLSAQRYAAERVAEQAEAICRAAITHARRRPARQSPIALPSLPAEQQQRYLDILKRYVDAGAESTGRAVLTGWTETATQRCTTCTRASMAQHNQRLLRLGRNRRGLLAPFLAPKPAELERAIANACPLAVLQKHPPSS